MSDFLALGFTAAPIRRSTGAARSLRLVTALAVAVVYLAIVYLLNAVLL